MHPLFYIFLFVPCMVVAESLKVTPYRPTVSNPAELSALNHFELEFGAQFNQPGKSDERTSLPFLLKYPFHENWSVLIGGEAWVNAQNFDESNHSVGDTALLLKYYYPISQTRAIGFEGGAILPSAAQPIGQGRTNWLGNLIVSQDLADFRLDLNIGVIRQGYHTAEQDQYRYTWALAGSHPITEKWGVAGEFSGWLEIDQKSSNQWLMTLSYSVNRLLLVDFGGTLGLTGDASDYSAFVGFSWLFDLG